ncbi:hypothetical protein G9A89_009189 [Geosiphon pyriformis]|nr:hypothetical protein G9A89_009189 [Geosiphon pyriformis]
MVGFTKLTKKIPVIKTCPSSKGFWIKCVGIFLIFTVIFLSVLFLAIFPAVMRDRIKKSNLEFFSIKISSHTETSFYFKAKGVITNIGSVSTTIWSDGPLNMEWNSNVLGNFQIPQFRGSNGIGYFIIDQTFNISDSTKFGEFTKIMLNSENFEWTIYGKVNVRAFGITKKGLDYRKKVISNGGRGFKNSTASTFKIDNKEITFSATFNNPSIFEIQLGIFGVDVYYESTYLSPAQSENVTLIMGNNTAIFRGLLPSNFTLFNGKTMAGLVQRYIMRQPITFTSFGRYAKPDGVNEVSWLDTGIRSLEIFTLAPSSNISILNSFP